jgi:transposase
MGYRGKVAEQQRARELRGDAWTLQQIADEFGVAKSSVSLWVRDVEFEPRPHARARRREPNALQRRKQAEIDEMLAAGRGRIGRLSDRDLLIAGTLLYAGEGSKTDGAVKLANSDAQLIRLFCMWLRRFFAVDESRLRVRLYLHQGLDLDAAQDRWSTVTGIPLEQFRTPYRAVADPSIRRAKHVHGCATVTYCCSRTHREIMGLMAGVIDGIPGDHRRVPDC